MIHEEIIEIDKYKFFIQRRIETYRDEIIIHTYKVGGNYKDCITISYRYKESKPVQATIPHLLYEPECAVDTFLEKGSGTEILIKSALRYAYKDVTTIPYFEFTDNSHIDCVDKDLTKKPPRKPIKPLNLAFFYIAYHGITWYEARFNAKMIDTEKYKKYKKSLSFLEDPSKKVAFIEFLQIIGITDSIKDLESIYVKASTYREFFNNIPKTKRCDLLFGWLNTFMNYYIGSTFDDKGWYIDIRNMDKTKNIIVGGSLSSKKTYRLFSYKEINCIL